MSKIPTITAEVAFTGGDASPSWTDISAYVQKGTINRGRSREVDQFNAGTLSLQLSNNDRRFDPEYASGPYFGNLLPMKPIRITATWNAVSYVIFRGYVDSWPQVYDIPNISTTTITATDGFKKLERAILLNPYLAEINSDSPTHWWTLGEASGSTATDRGSSPVAGAYVGSPTLGASALVALDTSTSVTFGNNKFLRFDTKTAFVSHATFSMESWLSSAAPATFAGIVMVGGFGATPGPYAYLQMANDGQIEAAATNAAGTGVTVLSGTTYADSQPHHAVAVIDNGGSTITLYVDGVSKGSSALPASWATPVTGAVVGALSGLTVADSYQDYFQGSLEHVALYDNVALSSQTVLNHYNAGANGFSFTAVGDKAGQRVARILDWAGWDSSLRNLDAGKESVVAAQAGQSGNTALDAMHIMDDTEDGQMFMTSDGKVRFRSRWGPLSDTNSITSQATFGDSGTELPYADIQFSLDDTLLRNYVTGTRLNGVQQVAKDATSISTYGTVSYSRPTTYEALDVDVQYAVQYLMTEGKDVKTRIQSIVVNGEADFPNKSGSAANSLYPQMLGREIGERITVKRRPQGVGTAISKPLLIEGIQHDFSQSQWLTTFMVSPPPGLSNDGSTTTGYLVLNDTTLGKLNSNLLGF